jgi:lipopolysaccharide/colanic/teichoic acid biosynthesis glycosyltransferase
LREVQRSIENPYRAMKIWFDVPLALVMLAVSWPIILLALVLVLLTSRGPVLYSQRRLGHNGRPFQIYKIRTMIPNSEPNGPRWCVPSDPRVTPVGRFLRWSHIDELPQLINVLRGEMTLIGPRPERPEIVAQLEHVLPWYRQRLSVRPGLTGLAQVLSPPDTDISTVRTKLSYDRHYVHHLGPWLDIKIGLATVFHLIRLPVNLIRRVFRFADLGTDVEEMAATSPRRPPWELANLLPPCCPLLAALSPPCRFDSLEPADRWQEVTSGGVGRDDRLRSEPPDPRTDRARARRV